MLFSRANLKAVLHDFCAGRTDEATKRLDDLRAWESQIRAEIRGASSKAPPDSHPLAESLLLARVLASALLLVRLDKRGAAEVLDDYLTYDDRSFSVKIKSSALPPLQPPPSRYSTAKVRKATARNSSSFVAALLHVEIGNLIFRASPSQVAEGEKRAKAGRDVITSGAFHFRDDLISAKQAFILGALARCWYARLAWYNRNEADAFNELESLRRELKTQRVFAPEVDAGIDLVSAIVLDLLADLQTSRGEHSKALPLIMEAASLIDLAECADVVRHAHVLYTFAKVAVSGILDQYVALLLFRRAGFIYGKAGHPLRFRALNREIRTMVRASTAHGGWHLLDEAYVGVGDAMSALKKSPEVPPDERLHCEEELSLTRAFALEYKAQRENTSRWHKEALNAAEELRNMCRRSDSRVKHEADLRYSIATIRSCRDGIQKRTEREIDGILINVGEHSGATAQIASLFARAELYLNVRRKSEAQNLWTVATRRLASVESIYLREWRDRLASQLEMALEITIPANHTLAAAERVFKRSFLTYKLMTHDYDVTATHRDIKTSRAQIYRMANELGIKTTK